MSTNPLRNVLAAVCALSLAACISPDSPLVDEASEGCSELSSGADFDGLNVDENVRAIMYATVDFTAAAENAKQAASEACAGIALDLGAQDTWSALESAGARLSNSDGTGACDQAAARIEALVAPGGTVTADIAIAVSRGECHIDYSRQLECDQKCSLQQSCDPGAVEVRCEPASLSVLCEAQCQANATCVGTPALPANCMGACQSECQGECKGTCIDAETGEKTEENPNCRGKCSSACNGKCRGLCKIQEPTGVHCGANVRCTGGCSGSYTGPACTVAVGPPNCSVDEVCHEACTARVVATPSCTQTTVDVYISTNSPELQPLVATLKKHLPALIDAAETQGKLAMDAGSRLVDAGAKLEGKVETLGGKSLACLGESSAKVAASLDDVKIAVDSSARITVMLDDTTL